MSKKTKMEITRENFLKLRGGKLISIESTILAFALFIILAMIKNYSFFSSLILAFFVGFVFPILVGTFKSLAWMAAILFSFFWGLLAFILAGAIANGSVMVGLIVGFIFFLISFLIHKNYSGLLFQGMKKQSRGRQERISSNADLYETVSFCSKCGRRITAIDGLCDTCDR